MGGYLDSGVLGNDPGSAAGGIQQHPVHRLLSQYLGQLPPIVAAHDGVTHTHTLQVGLDGLEPLLVDLIGEDGASVAQESCHICGLATYMHAALVRSFDREGGEGRGWGGRGGGGGGASSQLRGVEWGCGVVTHRAATFAVLPPVGALIGGAEGKAWGGGVGGGGLPCN